MKLPLVSLLRVIIACALALFILIIPGRAEILGKTESQPNIHNAFDLAQEVFTAASLAEGEIKLQFWGEVNNELQHREELREKFNFAVGRLGLPEGNTALQADREGFILLSNRQSNARATVRAALQTVPYGGGKRETYFSAFISTGDWELARDYYRQLSAVRQYLGCQDPVGVSFCGLLPYNIKMADGAAWVYRLVQEIGGEEREIMQEGRLTSAAFYTEKGSEAILVNGRKINLHIALIGQEQDNGTEIIVGAPLIYQNY